MADPVSIAAIAGLAYLGKRFSDKKESDIRIQNEMEEDTEIFTPEVPDEIPLDDSLDRIPQRKLETSNFSDIVPQSRSSGGELLEMRNRMFDNGRMNNLSPIEKQLVGPGLGVGPEVPAYGGQHQLFRVNPENVAAYRLTTLPGRSGPAFDISGGRRGQSGDVAQNRPEKTAYLFERRPVQPGRAQGMTGVTVRSEHEQTKRLTNRSQTGARTDNLGFNGAKRIISGTTLAQDPTRNKKDGNTEQYGYNNNPAPSIHKFAHGYVNSPATKIGEKRTYGSGYTADELFAHGFRPDDRRGKANRMGNAGRMNVRAGALNQGGMPTAARTDQTRIDGRVNSADGAWTQQYTNNAYHNFNAFKGQYNPNASNSSLGIAKKQLSTNPVTQNYF